jgi:hypothetical protein
VRRISSRLVDRADQNSLNRFLYNQNRPFLQGNTQILDVNKLGRVRFISYDGSLDGEPAFLASNELYRVGRSYVTA